MAFFTIASASGSVARSDAADALKANSESSRAAARPAIFLICESPGVVVVGSCSRVSARDVFGGNGGYGGRGRANEGPPQRSKAPAQGERGDECGQGDHRFVLRLLVLFHRRIGRTTEGHCDA